MGVRFPSPCSSMKCSEFFFFCNMMPFLLKLVCSNEAKQTMSFFFTAKCIQIDVRLICSFSMQSIQNLGLAVISQVAGTIVDQKGYLVLEVFFCAWLCGTCSNYFHPTHKKQRCDEIQLFSNSLIIRQV